MVMGLFHFQIMYDVLHDLHFKHSEEELLDFVVSKLSEAFNSEGGTIFILKEGNRLYPAASHGAALEELRKNRFEVGKGVVGWVVEYMQPVKVENPANDPRFYKEIDLMTGFKTKSIIAAPITSKNKPLGVLEFLNRRDRPFVIQDLELISMLGREIGIALENIRLIRELELQQIFSRAVSKSLSAGLVTIDMEDNLVSINPRACSILEIEPGGDKNFIKSLSKCPEFIKVLKKVKSSDDPIMRSQVEIKIDGKDKVIGYSGMPVINNENARIGSAILFQDITKLKGA
ncbi:MAG: GAF domain-containing protein [Elusimicrobia bacterium]|nr:GAF domain-containing protein [Elusimicrobiota bacterium]